jgi:hypothetical protein
MPSGNSIGYQLTNQEREDITSSSQHALSGNYIPVADKMEHQRQFV